MKKDLEFEGKPPHDQENPPEKTEKPKKLTVEDKIIRLERLIAKICHFTGQQRCLDEFKIPWWKPGQKDMSKYTAEE